MGWIIIVLEDGSTIDMGEGTIEDSFLIAPDALEQYGDDLNNIAVLSTTPNQ